jgi:hypothetical protein
MPLRLTIDKRHGKGSAPRAHKEYPRLPSIACTALRPFLFASVPFQEWVIPLPLHLLPPAFARRRSAFVFQMPRTIEAKANANEKGRAPLDSLCHQAG